MGGPRRGGRRRRLRPAGEPAARGVRARVLAVLDRRRGGDGRLVPALPRLSRRGRGTVRGVRVARLHHRRVAAHARGAALVLHARGLPLARRAQEDARQDPRRAPRQKKPEQDPELRIRNFQEVSYGYDSELAVAEASRCLQCKKPACVDGCPVGVDIPGFVGWWPRATSPARPGASARRTRCRPSAGASARRTTSARRSACWATRASRSPSARSSGSPPTSSARPTR